MYINPLRFNQDKIIEEVDIVEYIGQYVDLYEDGGEYWGLCPLHDEKTPSFSVHPEKKRFYCHGCKSGGNVINFTCKLLNINYLDAMRKIMDTHGIDAQKTSSIMYVLKNWKQPGENKHTLSRVYLREDIMDRYAKRPIEEWIEEGIDQDIMDFFQVRYDDVDNRIVFPIWDNDGKIISVSGRTIDPDYKKKKLRKYTYYGKITCNDFLYGYYQNKAEIEAVNKMIIFEGAKSVFKGIGFGYGCCVASMTDALSKEQCEFICKTNVKDIIIAWDKGVDISHIRKQVEILKHFKNVYVILDTGDLLEDKDSPVDKGIDVWKTLFEQKRRL